MAALWKLPSARRERQPSLHQLPGEEPGLAQHPRASVREADGGGSHPEIGHQMKEPELRFAGQLERQLPAAAADHEALDRYLLVAWNQTVPRATEPRSQ